MTDTSTRLLSVAAKHAGWLAILPLPLWLLFQISVQPEAAWIAKYVPANADKASVTRFEAAVNHYWTGKKEVLELPPVEPKDLKASFDTCISLDSSMDVPLMLVASGAARLLLDDRVVLEITESGEHTTRGKVERMTPGVHHLHVEFTGRTNPIVGILASFDDGPPRPIGSGTLVNGVRTFRPQSESHVCAP